MAVPFIQPKNDCAQPSHERELSITIQRSATKMNHEDLDDPGGSFVFPAVCVAESHFVCFVYFVV